MNCAYVVSVAVGAVFASGEVYYDEVAVAWFEGVGWCSVAVFADHVSFFGFWYLGWEAVAGLAVKAYCARPYMDVMNLAPMTINTILTPINMGGYLLGARMAELALNHLGFNGWWRCDLCSSIRYWLFLCRSRGDFRLRSDFGWGFLLSIILTRTHNKKISSRNKNNTN